MRFLSLLAVGGGYPILIGATALMDLGREAFRVLGQHPDTRVLLEGLDYLLLAEWVVILAVARRVDWAGVRATWWERVFGLMVAAWGLLSVAGNTRAPTMAMCGLIAAKFVLQPGARRIGAAIAIVGLQNLPSRLPVVHLASAHVDALAVHALLTAAGFPNNYHGTVVSLSGATMEIVITEGCATSMVAARVAAAFLVFALCWRAPVEKMARGLVLAIGGCFILNVLRLSLMAQSQEDFEYWHFGEGYSILSVAEAAIAFYAASWASRAGQAGGTFVSADGERWSKPGGADSA